MMQNLPLLVAQPSPAKNAMTSTTSNIKPPSEKAEEGKSFKQVLSKQVEQEDAKPTADKSNSAKGEVETKAVNVDKQASQKVAPEKHGDAAVIDAQLLASTVETKVNNEDRQVSQKVAPNERVDLAVIDAQLLASTVTAKTVQDVTDGEVVLDAAQEADASALSLANIAPTIQSTIQPNVSDEPADIGPEVLVEKQLVQTKQQDAGIDVKTTTKDDVANLKGKLDDPLVENEQLTNHKLANYLVGEKKSQQAQELSISQALSNVENASALSSASMTTVAKPLSQPTPATAQVGFSNLINVTPGKSGWSEAIGQKVVWMVGAAEQSATLTLNPKDLGPLQVIINVNNEKADATFISENPEVRKALEEGMAGLRQSMGQAGVELGQANVNTSKQHQEFQQATKGYSARQSNEGSMGQDVENMSNIPVNTRVSNGLVDTFV